MKRVDGEYALENVCGVLTIREIHSKSTVG